jgi:hypothetical protein
VSDPILNSRTRRAEPRPDWFEPWPVVWFVDCQRACVRPPHHDGAGFERVDQADADRVTVRGDPWCHDLAACQRERDLEPGGAAGQILVAFSRGHVLAVLPDSTDQVVVSVAEALRDLMSAS